MNTFARSSTNFLRQRNYGAIYADPPWAFRNWSAKGTGRNAVSHYDCPSFDKLAALPVSELAAPNCALFLWATDPLLPRAFDLLKAWGFEYKTVAFHWVKLTPHRSMTRTFSRAWATGPEQTPNSVYWQLVASRPARLKMFADSLSSDGGNTVASRIASANGSSD
jgi:hypothetical protein